MQSRIRRATGIVARVLARLRGDRFMVDAYPPAAVMPERRPDPAPVPSRESRREGG
jgi:hypothetical protein